MATARPATASTARAWPTGKSTRTTWSRLASPTSELRIVATGCLALVADDQPKYLPWLRSQRDVGRFVVVDANLRPAIVSDMAAYRASVLAALGQAHLIKVSDDDLIILGMADQEPLDNARALLAETPRPGLPSPWARAGPCCCIATAEPGTPPKR